MFRCDVNECKCIVESSGELLDIVCDVARAIGGLYNGLKQNDKVLAEVFKKALQHTMEDGSPAWEPSGSAIIFDLSKKMAVPPPVKVRAPHMNDNLRRSPKGLYHKVTSFGNCKRRKKLWMYLK